MNSLKGGFKVFSGFAVGAFIHGRGVCEGVEINMNSVGFDASVVSSRDTLTRLQ